MYCVFTHLSGSVEGRAVVPSNGDDPLARVRVVWNTGQRNKSNIAHTLSEARYIYIKCFPIIHVWIIHVHKKLMLSLKF